MKKREEKQKTQEKKSIKEHLYRLGELRGKLILMQATSTLI